MGIKTAPAPGQIVRQTTETEVISNTKLENDKRPPDFWDYIEALRPEEYGRHIIYVYRWLDSGELSASTKVSVPIDIFGLKEVVGGGAFRLILKNGPQICRRIEKCILEGAPKTISDVHSASTANAGGETNAVNRLCNLLETMLAQQNGGSAGADAFRGALSLQEAGFKSVLSNVQAMTPAPVQTDNPFSNPTTMLNFFVMAKQLFAPSGGNSVKETLEMIAALKDAGIVGGGGDGKFSIAQEVLRLAPQVLGQLGQGMTAMAEAKKAEANAAIVVAGGGRPALPVAVNPNPLPTPIETTAAPPAEATPPAQNAIIQFIESKIADLVMDEKLSVAEAANDALAFLQVAAPMIMKQLLEGGEPTMNHIFNSEPAFARVPKNPRLTEFIKKFLELGNAGNDLSTNDAMKPA